MSTTMLSPSPTLTATVVREAAQALVGALQALDPDGVAGVAIQHAAAGDGMEAKDRLRDGGLLRLLRRGQRAADAPRAHAHDVPEFLEVVDGDAALEEFFAKILHGGFDERRLTG